MLILVIQKAVDIEVPGLIITMVGLKRLIHEDIHSMNSKMLKLTCFDVTFIIIIIIILKFIVRKFHKMFKCAFHGNVSHK